jgi:hypothetical protein
VTFWVTVLASGLVTVIVCSLVTVTVREFITVVSPAQAVRIENTINNKMVIVPKAIFHFIAQTTFFIWCSG